jgi:CubicO group peptidase (beta-lactamase class C family)
VTRFRLLTSAGCLTLMLCGGLAQATSPDDVLASKLRAVTAVLDANLAKESVPGAAFAIVSDQDIVWSHQYGVEDLAMKTPVTNDTTFSICSVSKLFTGIAVMDMQEAGQLDIDAPLSRYLGSEAGGSADATVRNILSHVSGLPREGGTDFWYENTFPDDVTLRDDLAARDDWYGAYDHWQYSNLAMASLGQVIFAASGQTYQDYVQTHILDPLGMDRTTTDMPFEKVGQGFARGYYVRDAKGNRNPVQTHKFKAFSPAAGVASSINDLSKFMSWHFRLREASAPEVLTPKTLKTMQRVHWTGEDFDEPAWGLAYGTRRLDGKTLWGHGGYCPGTVTEFVMRNPDKIGVIAIATANDVSAGAMARTIYALVSEDVKLVTGDKDMSKEDGEPDHSFDDYEGVYSLKNYDWNTYIGLAPDGLFSIPLYDDKPQDEVETYEHIEGDLFKRQRSDGSQGEPLRFLRDDSGAITGVISAGYRLDRE